MKTFFALGITHKIFKDFEEVFVFEDPEMFCYFSELFHLDEQWEVGYNTNTKNILEYINCLNTDTERMFMDYEDNFFETTDEVDLYYYNNIDEYKTSVYDYLTLMQKSMKDMDLDISSDMNEDDDHKIHFPDGSYKNYYSLESLQHFLTNFNYENISRDLIKVQINHYKVSFDEYIETMKLFDESIELPDEVFDVNTLNHFLNALSEIGTIASYFDEMEEKEIEDRSLTRREKKDRKDLKTK